MKKALQTTKNSNPESPQPGKTNVRTRTKFERPEPLWPVNPSIYKLRRIPRGMTPIEMTHDTSYALERIALDIYTDMSNAGRGLAETLASIYLSGLQHAVEVLNAEPPDPRS